MTREELHRKSIAVLMGGWSAEREISLDTGQAVLGALQRLGYDCRAVDVNRQLAEHLSGNRPDIAFIALHGRGGEDGAVQGFLEVMNIPYTGSGILASALAMNKKYSKWLFECHGIDTPPYSLFTRHESISADEIPFGFPVVVKPVSEGSTIGVNVVTGPSGLAKAANEAFSYGDEILVEQFIEGREMTVGMIGRRILPPLEIIPEEKFYDFRAKYESSGTRYVVPAEVSENVSLRLEELSQRAASALNCQGAVRVDFRISLENDPFLLEVNTIPGMTEKSLLPKAAKAYGLSFDELVEEILFMAVVEK